MKSLNKKLFFLFFFLFLILSFSAKKKEKKETILISQTFLAGNCQSFPLSQDTIFFEDNFLTAIFPSFQIFFSSLASKTEREEILEYEVQKGETLEKIAEKFNLKVETILWANNLTGKRKLKEGEKLIILPIDGILHFVKEGETLSKIAETYRANLDEIISYNQLKSFEIFPGDILIIPGGKMPSSKKGKKETLKLAANNLTPLSSAYFICPVSGGCKITQSLHFYNALDFSNGKCGEPILAAAGGKVQRVEYGWNGGAGNYLSILHPNGVVTKYYHLEKIFVSPFQEVSQGEIIGTMGKTGRATGCHLHFEVHGAQNPFVK